MFRKPILISALAATAAVATLSTSASADPVIGGLLGAGIGAAVGHNISGRDGAIVGGVLGAVAGSAIGANDGYYNDRGYVGTSYAYDAPVAYPADLSRSAIVVCLMPKSSGACGPGLNSWPKRC